MHAHLLDTLLTGRRIRRSVWVDWSLIAMLGLGMPVLLTALPRRWMLPATAAAIAVLVGLCCLAMTRGYCVGLVVPTAAMIGSFLTTVLRDTTIPKALPELDPLE